MKIKEQAIKELEALNPAEMLRVYDLILSLKGKKPKKTTKELLPGYIRVREALKQCKGSLSEDISLTREDRV